MPPSSFQQRLIVLGTDDNPTYLHKFDFQTGTVNWTRNRSEARRLGPTDVSLASHLLRGKSLDYRVVKETYLKVCKT